MIADVLCGASEVGFPQTTPQSKEITDKSKILQATSLYITRLLMMIVAAVVLMGDPSHVAHQSFDAGSSVRDGVSSLLTIFETSN